MLDLVGLLWGHDAVLERQLLRIVDAHAFVCAVELHIIEEQVVYRQSFQAGDLHCFLGVHTGDMTEGEVAPFGVELRLVI